MVTKVKAAEKPKEEPEVIVISSDDETEEKEKKQYVPKTNKARDKNAKAFSSVLSARSKVVPLFLFYYFAFWNVVVWNLGAHFHCCLCSNNTYCPPLGCLWTPQGAGLEH